MILPLDFSLLFVLHAFDQTEDEVRNRLLGTWKLVSTEDTLKDGTTRLFPQFGPHAQGFLRYQADGYMYAILANPDRTNWSAQATGRIEEAMKAGEGTFAYCGRYEVDVKKGQIIHVPEVATNPEYVNSRQIRPYQFEGDRLILSDTVKGDPQVARWKIVWEKVK